jgi:hypothetical protein
MPLNAHKVVLTLRGDFIPVATFVEAASRLCALLAEVDTSISGRHSLEWGIAGLRASSAVLEATPRVLRDDYPDNSPEVISAVVMGMQQIDKQATRPKFFSDEALEDAKQLAGVLNGYIDRIDLRAIVRGRPPVTASVTQRVAANVNELIGPRYTALGSIEGTMELVSIHGTVYFNVYDLVTRRKVRCICEREILNELIGSLGKRLLVYGEIRFNAAGLPVSIRVEKVRVLRERAELPQPTDLKRIPAGQQGAPERIAWEEE